MEGSGIAALEKRAAGGDADAQYALAAQLSRSGRRDEAERWLQSAARHGCADAIYTLATRHLNSSEGAAAAAPQLALAANAGSAAAIRQLAVLRALGIGAPRDEAGALSDVFALAEAGDAAAQGEIACVLALSDPDNPDISSLAAAACGRDVAAAAFLLARAQTGCASDDAAIVASISTLEKSRYPRAKQLSAPGRRAQSPVPPIDWSGVRAAATLSAPLHAAPEKICAAPDIVIWRSAIAPEVCEYAIARAAPRLGPSLVYDPVKSGMMRDPLRTSQTASLSPIDLDLAFVALNRAIALAVGCPEENGEFLSVLRYAPGQQYRPHFDCIPAGPDRERSGQRIKTALLFLNDDYEGGETHFLKPELKIKGKPGDLLVFSNVLTDGAPDLGSRHAGLAVESGEKWLGSKWFRSKKFHF